MEIFLIFFHVVQHPSSQKKSTFYLLTHYLDHLHHFILLFNWHFIWKVQFYAWLMIHVYTCVHSTNNCFDCSPSILILLLRTSLHSWTLHLKPVSCWRYLQDMFHSFHILFHLFLLFLPPPVLFQFVYFFRPFKIIYIQK